MKQVNIRKNISRTDTNIILTLLILYLCSSDVYCSDNNISVFLAQGGSAEINSVPSGEPGVSLKKISTDEDQCEWPFERALQ